MKQNECWIKLASDRQIELNSLKTTASELSIVSVKEKEVRTEKELLQKVLSENHITINNLKK